MDHKNRLLDALLRDVEMVQAIVFASTKRSTEEISDLLSESGFASDALHGDMQQGQRNRALQRLREGRTKVLVATDVAARGIDVAGISHVINFDLPRQAEDYVHRIGRTGRAGRTGIAVSFAGMREGGLVKNIERYTGNRIEVHTLPGLEPTQKPSSGRPPAGRPSSSGRPRTSAGPRSGGFGDKRSEPRSYGDRPPRGDSRDNRDRGYRADARPAGDRPARSDAPRGNRFENAARAPGPSDVPRMTGDRPSRNEGYRGAAAPAPRAEVNGNSVEYWEKREREAKAKAATPRSYGDRGNSARPSQPRTFGNDNRGGSSRVGVRGRFKD
jgi:superfamily II DNA/RNA helicase